MYASVRDKELPVCVYDGNSYLCHPDADIEIRRRQNADENYYLFNFNETESHRRKEPVPAQCPVVVSMCNESSHLCQGKSELDSEFLIGHTCVYSQRPLTPLTILLLGDLINVRQLLDCFFYLIFFSYCYCHFWYNFIGFYDYLGNCD